MNSYKKTLFDLEKKVAIITGGTGTLGSQYARTLASAGAHTVIADLDESKCTALAKEINDQYGAEAMGVQMDVSNQNSVNSAINKIIKHFNSIDILINNAGVSGKFNPTNIAPTFENYPLEEWQKATDVNITGMLLCAQAVGMIMKQQQHGVIINVSSTYGLVSPDQRIYTKDNEPDKVFIKPISYCVTKSAVLNFTRYLATYYAPYGIRVNTLTPGGVDDGSLDDEFKRKYSDKTPLGRMANPTDYNGAILYLCSDASQYMTGANLIVDGGWTAW